MRILGGANLALRFLLELAALAALAYWGYETGTGAYQWILAVGLPSAAAILWVLFVAPQPSIGGPAPVRFAFELLILGGAAGALAATGHVPAAVVFAALVVANRALLAVWKQ